MNAEEQELISMAISFLMANYDEALAAGLPVPSFETIEDLTYNIEARFQ